MYLGMILKSAFFAWPVSLGVGSHQISRSFSDPSKKSKSPDISVVPYACVFPPFWLTPLNKTVKHSSISKKHKTAIQTANLRAQLLQFSYLNNILQKKKECSEAITNG